MYYLRGRKNEFYKLAYVYTESKEDAMDAMEDMIVILYKEISKLKNEDAFYGWSKTILVNCCKSILRKKKKLVLIEEFEEAANEEGYENNERKIDIQKHLSTLSEHQQEVIKLKYFMDLDYETIAQISNVPVGTVKSRLSTGLKKLKEAFGGEF